jgi:hypothetical protein
MHRMITANLIICHPFIFRGVGIVVTINQNFWYTNLQACSELVFKRGSRQCYFIFCEQLVLTDQALHLLLLMMRAPFRYFLKLLLLLISSSSFSYCFQIQSSILPLNHSLSYLIWTLKSLHSHVITATMPFIFLVFFSSPSFQERIIIVMMMQLAMMIMRAWNIRQIYLLQVIVVIFTVAQISVVLLGVIEKLSQGYF